jgi:hypothetical protein
MAPRDEAQAPLEELTAFETPEIDQRIGIRTLLVCQEAL